MYQDSTKDSHWIHIIYMLYHPLKQKKTEREYGFTFLELMIVVALMAILLTVGLTNWKKQSERAVDARKKAELNKIKTAFENYYNDNQCYPPLTIMNPCRGNQMANWGLPQMYCDPDTGHPYVYQLVDPTDCRQGFRVFARLRDTHDADIAKLNCTGSQGCATFDGVIYNYGVSSGVPVSIY